ncbi:MAG: CocE/NonD family hydrolase, partial [Dehalococcoidia bacterium]
MPKGGRYGHKPQQRPHRHPSTWPQYPYDEPPPTPERSEPRYGIHAWTDVRIPVRDGTKLATDIYRPYAPEQRFPALVSFSPYTRQLQQTVIPLGQNEAGITEFWVPRGYAHVIVDLRGSNDSGGSWDFFGPTEQQDMYDVIEWVAEQPWCDGNVGMMGCSYFGMTQLLVAELRPPHLKAVFPYDAETDMYRDWFYHGGITSSGGRTWLTWVQVENLRSGRLKDTSGIIKHSQAAMGLEHPLDGPYWQERSSWPRLGQINIPVYFGCDWQFLELHLRGAFQGWEETGNIPKRLLLGPRSTPRRPWAAYHMEALRWYDHWLKGMDTRVMEGPPLRLYIPGDDHWRSESEWPLARTQWRELFLGGPEGGLEGRLLDAAGPDGERSYNYDPHNREVLYGRPCLVYRSDPVQRELEITGPIALYLHAASSATDTDWYVRLYDEGPDGQARLLCKGWLRASHREVDPGRSKPWQPWHPHGREEPLVPKEAYEFPIEIWPTSNVFRPGHRIRLEVGSSDTLVQGLAMPNLMPPPATNTVLEGRSYPSRLLLPV